jgi:hypothetical protein
MKNVVWKNVLFGFLFLSAAVFAQAPSDNAGVVLKPRVCAVRLLNASSPETAKLDTRGNVVQFPAPPCDNK